MGGDTIHILSEESIKVYLVYMDQLKNLFTKFIHDNWNDGRKVSQVYLQVIINLALLFLRQKLGEILRMTTYRW